MIQWLPLTCGIEVFNDQQLIVITKERARNRVAVATCNLGFFAFFFLVKMFFANIVDPMDCCRICLVTEQVDINIFDVETEEDENLQLLIKINVCLPIKVAKDDNLPKKICANCLCKLESFYQFYNMSARTEQHLSSLLSEENPTKLQVLIDDKKIEVVAEKFMVEEFVDEKPDSFENTQRDDNNFFDERYLQFIYLKFILRTTELVGMHSFNTCAQTL